MQPKLLSRLLTAAIAETDKSECCCWEPKSGLLNQPLNFKQMQDVKVGRWQEELFSETDVLERAFMSSAVGASAKEEHQFRGTAVSNGHLISSKGISCIPWHTDLNCLVNLKVHIVLLSVSEQEETKLLKSTTASLPIIPFKLVKVYIWSTKK